MFYRNVAEPFLLNVRCRPEKIALVFRGERYTYRELNERINRIANALADLGVGPGDRVAFLFPNCPELVEIFYALQKLGAAAVPLNFRLGASEISCLLNASDAKTLLFSEQFADTVREVRPMTGAVSSWIPHREAGGFSSSLADLSEEACGEEPSLISAPESISRIQFTGGSTGRPKGVMRTHEQDLVELMGELLYNKLGACPDQVVLIQCPLEHHGGHSWFTAALASGGTLVICDAFDPARILEQVQREGVTYMLLLPPSTFLRLCEYPGLKEYDVSSVRMVQSAAGCTTPEIVRHLSNAFPNAEIYYGWGQTESGLGTSLVLTREMAEQRDPRMKSVGRPMPFVEMKIVDEAGDELPDGEVGEAAIRSPAIMSGYYLQPDLTAAVLDGAGWLRTGDMMRRDGEGYFYLLSRKKDMIKSGGENVFAQEVEGVLREHPAVAECLVVGVPDPVFGEAVLALVRPRPGETVTLSELQEHCKRKLASYKKPRYLEFTDHFPMDDAGKIRKQALCRELWSRYGSRTNTHT